MNSANANTKVGLIVITKNKYSNMVGQMKEKNSKGRLNLTIRTKQIILEYYIYIPNS